MTCATQTWGTMTASLTTRAFCLMWIPLSWLCFTASAKVSELTEAKQRELLYRAEVRCNITMMTQPVTLTGMYCPRTWDRVMCWPDSAPGTVSYQPCPAYINRFDQTEYASKQCLENGTWYADASSGRPWTDYSDCIRSTNTEAVPELIVQHMPGVKLMYTIGYSLSLGALILAVTIMVYFRRLHCARNMIHLNMFLAFLGRAAFSLMKNVLLVKDLGFPNDVNDTGHGIEFIHEGTHWQCKLFFTLFYYIIFASLMGLFNEGLYLVLILSVSVFAEKTKIRWFVLLGWGVPVIFVIPWVICRIRFDDMLCWNVHVRDDLFWILRGPMVASVAVNFAFFVNIVRMLFTKLTASNCPESRRVRYRKLAKSTLILIPLFAVYYMGFIWLPDDLSPLSEVFKMYVEMLFNSFQGFLVALLFCFLNAEVQNEIRKKWKKQVLRRSGSWRSQPSFGSFLRRSIMNKDASGSHNNHRHSHSGRSASISNANHSEDVTAAAMGVKTKLVLSAICEEASTGSSVLDGEKAPATVRVCGRQDCNDNRKNDTTVKNNFRDGDVDENFRGGDVRVCDIVKAGDDVTQVRSGDWLERKGDVARV